MKISTFLEHIKKWAQKNEIIDGILLVGSHARKKARPDSDIDLVILSSNPTQLLEEVTWIKQFGEVIKYTIEKWGMVNSIRTYYKNGQEVEFGITSPKWADVPMDAGTKKVILNGSKIIFDKNGILKKLLDAKNKHF